MFSLLIVDDEFFIREGLARDVNWESIGVTVIGAAQNGLEALELIRTQKPDVVLADITMGAMTGMEMAEKLRAEKNDVKIIFLSGYDDFAYMQKAIELKAFDYMLKPALAEELLDSVARATRELTRERDLRARIAALESNLAAGLLLARERFFEETSGGTLPPAMEERAAALGIPTAGYVYCAAWLEPDEASDGSARQTGRLLAMREIAEEYASALPFQLIFVRESHLQLILCREEAAADAQAEEPFDILLNKIRTGIRRLVGVTCTIGVSRIADTPGDVSACRDEAAAACTYKVTVGSDCIIHITDLPRTDHSQVFYPTSAEKRLLEALETLRREPVALAAVQFMDALVQRAATPVQIRAALAELVSVLTRRFLEWDMDIYESFRVFWTNPDSLLARYRTVPALCGWLTGILLTAVETLGETREAGIKGIVAQIQQLINDKYADADLSLSMLAEKVFVSTAYLSKLYKKETGETYVEYLTFVRMREAKRLLRTTNLKSAEIGLRVGYPNAQYFSVLFKKICGVSPIEYREAHGSE